jgi:hypothetical protein
MIISCVPELGIAVITGRLTVGAIFMLAAFGKLRDLPTRPLPGNRLAHGAAAIAELAIGVALVIGFTVLTATWAAIGLLAIYTTYLAVRATDPHATCNCLGGRHHTSVRVAIARNAVLTGLAVLVGVGTSSCGIGPWTGTPAMLITGGIVAATFVFLYIALVRLAAYARRLAPRSPRRLSSL